MLAPPRPPSRTDELEALIREARARQRRRRVVRAAAAAAGLGVVLAAWAAIAGGGGTRHAAPRISGATATRGGETARVQILRVGSSGGVTWAINGRGMWLTTNGGRTWRASMPPGVRRLGDAADRISQVTFLDRRHGWLLTLDVTGTPSRTRHAAFYRTSDGGRTWRRSTPRGCCGAFSFVSRRLGFFAADSSDGRLYATRDAAATWRPVDGPRLAGIPTFLDARHGVGLVGTDLLWTADGGRNWQSARLPGMPTAAGKGVVNEAPAAILGRRLVLTAERPVASDWNVVPYLSDDAGATWTARPFPRWWTSVIGNNDGNRFSAASANVWFAAANRKLATTADAGRTWRRVAAGVPPGWTIVGIDFASARVGWAIFGRARESVLMRTTDGGVHWAPAGPQRPTHHRR